MAQVPDETNRSNTCDMCLTDMSEKRYAFGSSWTDKGCVTLCRICAKKFLPRIYAEACGVEDQYKAREALKHFEGLFWMEVACQIAQKAREMERKLRGDSGLV